MPLQEGCLLTIQTPSEILMDQNLQRIFLSGMFGVQFEAFYILKVDSGIVEISNACGSYRENSGSGVVSFEYL